MVIGKKLLTQFVLENILFKNCIVRKIYRDPI
jgi:hypothetical protein